MNPTRTIELWLANDEGLYSLSRDWARDSTSIAELARQLRDYFESTASEHLAGHPVLADLVFNALSEVQWYQIADDLREEHCKELESEEEEED